MLTTGSCRYCFSICQPISRSWRAALGSKDSRKEHYSSRVKIIIWTSFSLVTLCSEFLTFSWNDVSYAHLSISPAMNKSHGSSNCNGSNPVTQSQFFPHLFKPACAFGTLLNQSQFVSSLCRAKRWLMFYEARYSRTKWPVSGCCYSHVGPQKHGVN